MLKVQFDDTTEPDDFVHAQVQEFLASVETLEISKEMPVVIHRDGRSEGYYIKCTIAADDALPLLDMDARLDPSKSDSFRANRKLLESHNTFRRMVADAKAGREFNDLIVEYTTAYSPERPLKIWGGQHRAKAIEEAFAFGTCRSHGFKIFFCLTKVQRTDTALISNTNIAVSNDLFDRLQEETLVGYRLREWCYLVGLLKRGDDFPDQGSKSEKITVKLARSFVTNFCLGRERANQVSATEIDSHTYVPYRCESGATLDTEYERFVLISGNNPFDDRALQEAGEGFAHLHIAQYEAVTKGKILQNRKAFRNKAMTESVLTAWAYAAGLLQADLQRLEQHYRLPPADQIIPDPLNAREMSNYHHDSDGPTYRGLGTRSSVKDRERMVQLFLARSCTENGAIDKKLMGSAVSQVVALKNFEKGYMR